MAGLILSFAIPARSASLTRVPPETLVVGRPVPRPAGVLTLDQALALAAGHHPRLRGAAWRLHASTARRAGAGRMANPIVSVDVENLGGDAGNDFFEATAALGQTIELGGDRRARADVAEAAERVAWAELSAEEGAVLAEVAELYLRTWELQQRVHQLTEAERLAERSIAAAAERFRAGAGPAVEQTRAEAVQAQRRSDRIRALAELAASRQRLAAVWGGIEADFDSLALAVPRRMELPAPSDLDTLLAQHPKQRSAAAGIGLDEARVRESRAARVPDLDLSGGVRRLGAGGTTTFVVGASIPLPLWNAQRRSVDAAEAERQAAVARAQDLALELRGSLRAAIGHYQAAQESYELVAGTLVPRSEEVVRQLTAGYRNGRFSSLEYLEGQRSLLEAELKRIDAVADSWRTRLELERLVGRSVEDLGRGGGQ